MIRRKKKLSKTNKTFDFTVKAVLVWENGTGNNAKSSNFTYNQSIKAQFFRIFQLKILPAVHE